MTPNQKKYLFISVKPEFADKIIEKEKNIELRKSRPKVLKGDIIIIYSSSPFRAVVGYGKISDIIECDPKEMWRKHSKMLGIDRSRFFDYYKEKDRAIGIVIKDVVKIKPISLAELRCVDPHFHPPQVYKYVSTQIIKMISISS